MKPDHAVRVVLPLGKRHRDLYEANLLASVPGVPWLDGRILDCNAAVARMLFRLDRALP